MVDEIPDYKKDYHENNYDHLKLLIKWVVIFEVNSQGLESLKKHSSDQKV